MQPHGQTASSYSRKARTSRFGASPMSGNAGIQTIHDIFDALSHLGEPTGNRLNAIEALAAEADRQREELEQEASAGNPDAIAAKSSL